MNKGVLVKRSKLRFNIPVIGHFADRSIRFNSIIEAEKVTGITYTLIFESCIGKINKARNVLWEFENGRYYIKYKAHYMRQTAKLLEEGGAHGHGKHKELDSKEEKALLERVEPETEGEKG